MRRARENELVVGILFKAFERNPNVKYVVKQGLSCGPRIERLMKYSFEYCKSFGAIWIPDMERVLFLLPDRKRITIRTLVGIDSCYWNFTIKAVTGLREDKS